MKFGVRMLFTAGPGTSPLTDTQLRIAVVGVCDVVRRLAHDVEWPQRFIGFPVWVGSSEGWEFRAVRVEGVIRSDRVLARAWLYTVAARVWPYGRVLCEIERRQP